MNLLGDKIYLRRLKAEDALDILELRKYNYEFFQEHSPIFSDDYLTLEGIYKQIKSSEKNRSMDKEYSFGIFLKDEDILIGDINLFFIARGALQKCLIGYALDKRHNGKGYTSEAISLIVDFAFKVLKLHRIEGGVMLNNPGSMRVLEKNGFHKEGIERKGVNINGKWEDHQIFAIISPDN